MVFVVYRVVHLQLQCRVCDGWYTLFQHGESCLFLFCIFMSVCYNTVESVVEYFIFRMHGCGYQKHSYNYDN